MNKVMSETMPCPLCKNQADRISHNEFKCASCGAILGIITSPKPQDIRVQKRIELLLDGDIITNCKIEKVESVDDDPVVGFVLRGDSAKMRHNVKIDIQFRIV